MKGRKVKLTKADIAFALRAGAYWDTHSVADGWAQTRPVAMDFEVTDSCIVIPVSSRLAKQLDKLAKQKRQSAEEWFSRAVDDELASASH